MKTYSLSVFFNHYEVNVDKAFPSIKKALFWAQLCLDICGKDNNGNKFNSACLQESGKQIAVWG